MRRIIEMTNINERTLIAILNKANEYLISRYPRPSLVLHVSVNGKTYEKRPNGWFDIETNIAPPQVIIEQLNRESYNLVHQG